eukprot:gnl/MRDRNA2_/MRDRNA2_30047_c0_seq1.p1 gnl/MRDRNA2_/MRDRNA2_30047_c0~~gnl/MRDRNA2_/MRDRNA2_30047_c0_seq1.p1  ORF type:complete len:290 (+),score=52.86 gnl/MRDRNA2_/MRDRNA2_30047_c0_seq1:74-943(+)
MQNAVLFEDSWIWRLLFDFMADGDLVTFVQTTGFIDRAVTQWCRLTHDSVVLSQPGLKGLCSNPRQSGIDWRAFFWRCLRTLSSDAGIRKSKENFEKWCKVGDDIAGDMLIPDEGLYGKTWQGTAFGHTLIFHLFRFDPEEVEDVLTNPKDIDEGCSSCWSEPAFIQHPAYGSCSLQLEFSLVDDGAVFFLEIVSRLDHSLKVIEARSEVIMICPTGPEWAMLDKYAYYDPDDPDSDSHFWLNQNWAKYAEVMEAMQNGLPIGLLIATAGPKLPEEEEKAMYTVMRFFM